jgi:type IV pilus biogenesis protein CpaD/CtpE
MKARWVLAAGLLLAGCKLVDQTTFAPSPEAKPAAAPGVSKADPRPALVTIGYATPNPDYQDMLRYAVREAEGRAPGVQYDVVAILPPGGDTATAEHRATDVMRDIMAQGVAASRIHLGLRTAQAGTAQEVRVYVR